MEFPLTFTYPFPQDIDKIISFLKSNWLLPRPTIDLMANIKRINDDSYVLIYEYNWNQTKKGFHYDFIRRYNTFSLDIRTKLGYQDLKLIEEEVLRILHLHRKNPIENYDKLEILRRTDLSDKKVRLFHTVIDIELKKLYETL